MAQDSKTRYYRVAPKVWRHAKKAGWGDRETLLALYLLTCPHRNMAGLYYLPREYMQADLGWDAALVSDTLAALEDDDFLAYDYEAGVVLILNARAYDAPDNPNQVKAAMRQLEELPATPLLAALAGSALEHCPELHSALCSPCPHAVQPAAAVVRRKWSHQRRRVMPSLLAERGRACEGCGAVDDLTADHVVPISRGGRNDRSNLQVLCRSCNSRKGTRTPESEVR